MSKEQSAPSIAHAHLSRRDFLAGTAGVGAATLVGCAGKSKEESAEGSAALSSPRKVAIIHTNDTHGHDLLDDESFDLAAVSQLVADWEEKGYEALLLDAGDAV